MSKLKDLWKNEYVKSLIVLAIILGAVVGFWFGLKTYFRTENPLLAVASDSMVPTLKTGDLIVVQGGFNVSDIVAEYDTGDIIVFYSPYSPSELIVHRAVEKHSSNGELFLKTRGDNNPSTDSWEVFDSHLVGKVVFSVPYIGHIPLFVRTPTGMTIIVILIVILIIAEIAFPLVKKKEPEQPIEKPAMSDTGSSTISSTISQPQNKTNP